MNIESFPRPDWELLPREGCRNVEGRVLLVRPKMVLAMLRFAPGGAIDRHSAAHAIDVFCLEGEGYVSVGDESAPFSSGQRVVWPAGLAHQLWTIDSTMVTVMLEHTSDPRA